jgi:hypothetical protein
MIGYIHLGLSFIKNVYGYFSTPNKELDALYLITFATIPLSWISCKGECLVSYFIKKYENSDYVLGENTSYKDITDILGDYYNIYSCISNFVYIGSLVVVVNRTKLMSNYLLYSTLFLLVLQYEVKCKIPEIIIIFFLLSVMVNVILRFHEKKVFVSSETSLLQLFKIYENKF